MKLNLESPWGRRSTGRRKQASPWPLFPHPLTPRRKVQWGDDGDGMKNMPVAGQANLTGSLLAREHGEMKTGGEIKAENILEHKEGKHVKKTRRQYFGIWHVCMGIVKAISSPRDSGIFFWVHRAGNPWVRWESAVSSNEQRTLRLANKLTAEYYNKGGDERRGAAPAFRKHTQTYNSSQLFYLSLEDWLAGMHPLFNATFSPSIPLILHLCVCYSHTPRSRWHLPHACENITSSLTPTLCLPVLLWFFFFFSCMGWQISPAENCATYVISKTSSLEWKDTRKTRDRELRKGPSVTTAFLRGSFHPLPGLRSVPAASAWLPPSEHSRGAMSHGLTPSQILTVWLQPRKWSRMVTSEAKMTSQQAREWAIAG